MHGKPWKVLTVDRNGEPTSRVCQCGCGSEQTRDATTKTGNTVNQTDWVNTKSFDEVKAVA